jgi:hypothetical protein
MEDASWRRPDGENALDSSGDSVASSANGRRVAIGAPRNDNDNGDATHEVVAGKEDDQVVIRRR